MMKLIEIMSDLTTCIMYRQIYDNKIRNFSTQKVRFRGGDIPIPEVAGHPLHFDAKLV